MLLQRDFYISFEPTRIVTYKKSSKFDPGMLDEKQMLKVVTEGIAGNELLAGDRIKRDKDDVRDKNLIRNNLYNGWLNSAAARSMRSILMNWTQAIQMHSSKYAVDSQRIYPILLTLTWPCVQFVSDYDAKICLDKFLSLLNRKEDTRYEAEKRRIKGEYPGRDCKEIRQTKLVEAYSIHSRALRKYLWRAEPQKNGNIHFHVVLDQWIDKDEARKRWNEAVEELTGAVSMYQRERQRYFRVTHAVRNDPQTIYSDKPSDWKSTRPFVYRGYRFRVDFDAIKLKAASIQDRIKNALELNREPFLMEEGVVLKPIFKKAFKDYKAPTVKSLYIAAEQLQFNAFCKAVDNEFLDPPTSRIESMRKVSSMASYLAKYMAKPSVREVTNKVDLEKEAQKPGYEWVGEKLFDDQQQEVLPEQTSMETEGRRIHGRIWGKSRSLNTIKEFGFFKIAESSYTSFHGMVEMGHEVKEKKVTRKVPNPDLWGTMHYDTVTEIDRKVVPISDYKKATGSRIINAALPYYQTVLDFVGVDNYWQDTPMDQEANITILKLSTKTGGDNGIHINWSQTQLMKKFSPELLDAYNAHYHDLFFSIYNSPYHLKDGEEPPKYGISADHRIRFMPRIDTTLIAA